jgi:uncharacterized protein YxjI
LFGLCAPGAVAKIRSVEGMAISIQCQCGQSYNLKDELAGKTLRCPNCGATLAVNHEISRPSSSFTPHRQSTVGDPAFNRDKFLLRQKLLSISERYDVWDENGNAILYIERPAHFFRNVGAVILGGIIGLIALAILGFIASLLPEALEEIASIFIFLAWPAITFIAITVFYKKRHVTIYRDQSKQDPLLKVFQDKKFEILTATFTVRDAEGEIAKFRKNYFYDIFRKHWHCYTPDGSLLCIAKEDSIILSLLRRFLGVFFGLLRINFIIVDPNHQVLGEFNRKFTLLDRYVLDMSADRQQVLDRRIAVALGVMLDTGERR